MRRRGNKYGVAPAAERVYDGVTYHSRAESKYAATLDLRKRAGDVLAWERQRTYRLEVNGSLICKYVADFAVWRDPVGHPELHEIKGRETAEWRLKEKLFRALYPDIPLIVLDVKGRELRGRN